MRLAHITHPATELNFLQAARLAETLANEDADILEPVLVAWYDRPAARMSPVIEGADVTSRWLDYGASHSGQLEVDVAGDYAFIYADSSAFDPYGACPYTSLHDPQGNEYLCQTGLLKGLRVPTAKACVALDEWTSKLT